MWLQWVGSSRLRSAKRSLLTCEPTSIYLVEPRRVSSAVLKFSGTLGIRNRTDKRSATIMAFSHFVLESSACEYMFADLQGMHWFILHCIYSFLRPGSIDRGILHDTETVLTLFDPMTHTPLGHQQKWPKLAKPRQAP